MSEQEQTPTDDQETMLTTEQEQADAVQQFQQRVAEVKERIRAESPDISEMMCVGLACVVAGFDLGLRLGSSISEDQAAEYRWLAMKQTEKGFGQSTEVIVQEFAKAIVSTMRIEVRRS